MRYLGISAVLWVGAAVVDGELAEIKRLKVGRHSRLIAGFDHMDEPMTDVVADPAPRRTLAHNMSAWVLDRGCRGVDIDWEYPDTPEHR